MKASVKTITPAMAKRWLKRNTRNRGLNSGLVQRIAGDISSGNWAENGQSIVLDVDGILLDGQHRLHAIVSAGKPVRAVVVTGVISETFDTIDDGISRSFAHVCGINNEKNATLLSAIAKIVLRYEQGKPLTGHKISNRELNLFLDKRPLIRESVPVGSACRHITQPSVAGFCHYAFSLSDASKASTFFSSLETGANLGMRSPVLCLRSRLTDAKHDKHHRLSTSALIYLFFRAWVAYRDGRQMQKLQLPREGTPLQLPKA